MEYKQCWIQAMLHNPVLLLPLLVFYLLLGWNMSCCQGASLAHPMLIMYYDQFLNNPSVLAFFLDLITYSNFDFYRVIRVSNEYQFLCNFCWTMPLTALKIACSLRKYCNTFSLYIWLLSYKQNHNINKKISIFTSKIFSENIRKVL